jgi:hypothetical protein
MKKAIIILIGAAVLAITMVGNGPVWAGLAANNSEVLIIPIGTSGGAASGTMGGARYSDDATQFIGCTQRSSSGLPYVYCSAVDKTGQFIACSSVDLAVFTALGAMTDASEISFQVSRDGKCTSITVGNSSYLLR